MYRFSVYVYHIYKWCQLELVALASVFSHRMSVKSSTNKMYLCNFLLKLYLARKSPEMHYFLYKRDLDKMATLRHSYIKITHTHTIDLRGINKRGWLFKIVECRVWMPGFKADFPNKVCLVNYSKPRVTSEQTQSRLSIHYPCYSC